MVNREQTEKWIQKRDKYHEFWECSGCKGRVVSHDRMAVPPDRCPFCRSRMTAMSNEGDER